MVEQSLAKLGFSEKEVALYLVLLKHGKMTPAEITKITRINRPTVYSVGKELVKKGLLFEDLGGTSRAFVARPPDELAVLTNREEKKLTEKKLVVQRAIEELKTVSQGAKYEVPKIVFIPEEEFRDYFFKQTKKWHASMLQHDATWWGFQDHTFAEQFQDYIDWHWQKAAPKTLELKLLTNDSDVEVKMAQNPYPRRHVRFWNANGSFTASTWVCGDYVIMAITNVHPYYLVEIHDRTFAHNLRLIFKGIWEGKK